MASAPVLSPADRRTLRRRALLLSLALWSVIMALAWYSGTITGFDRIPPFELWSLRALWMVSAFALGWVIFRLLEAIVSRTAVPPVVALLALVCVFGMAHTLVNAAIFNWRADLQMSGVNAIYNALYWLHFQIAWGILILTLVMGARTRAERAGRIRAQREAHRAQIEALEFQVHPHFLFNTLGAVSALIDEGRFDSAEETVRKLAVFLRRGLRRDTRDDVPLAQEIEDLEVYLAIERIRFEARFDFAADMDEALADACIPSFLLQPLLENSIKYAVARGAGPVAISLTAWLAGDRDGDSVAIALVDDGPGASGAAGLGTGEENVRSRLVARFGEGIAFTAGTVFDDAGRPRGYRSDMRFPYEPCEPRKT